MVVLNNIVVSALFLESDAKDDDMIIVVSLITLVITDCVLRLLHIKCSENKNNEITISVMS